MTASVSSRPFGRNVDLFTLSDVSGVEVSIMTYGAAVQSFVAPDGEGRCANVALGFPTLDDYLASRGHYFGATVGRYANRIARARFAVDGAVHDVDRNEGRNCLHGGSEGFDRKVWDVVEAMGGKLRLTYSSVDGEMGFPGDLDVSVGFHLAGGELRIEYEAVTSAPRVVNLTTHTCWNLAGEGSGSVDGHVLTLNASSFTPLGPDLIPTGEIRPVEGTALDFRVPTAIGARGRGYDQNFVVDRRDALGLAARLTEPTSGRTLEVLTTEPGIQLYTGTFLDGTLVGPSGRAYGRGHCVALETQHFPDAPNQPSFPSTVLRPGETFRSTTVYRVQA
ncbi:MAG: aldose epimerase family protein [Gaiellaceae bacterium]